MLAGWTQAGAMAGDAMAGDAMSPMAAAMIGLPEMLVIFAIVVVLFGATKLPQLGKGLGEAIGNFKRSQRDAINEERQEIDATPKLTAQQSRTVDVTLEGSRDSAPKA